MVGEKVSSVAPTAPKLTGGSQPLQTARMVFKAMLVVAIFGVGLHLVSVVRLLMKPTIGAPPVVITSHSEELVNLSVPTDPAQSSAEGVSVDRRDIDPSILIRLVEPTGSNSESISGAIPSIDRNSAPSSANQKVYE